MAARKIDVNRQEVQKEVVDNLIVSELNLCSLLASNLREKLSNY